MAAYSTPKIEAKKSDDAAISQGMAVKLGTDYKHVTKGAAVSDELVGICQNVVTAAEGLVEVAIPGGGALGLCQTTVATGDFLTSHSDGKLKPCTSNNDHYIAQAKQDGVAGDLIGVEVMAGVYGA